MLATRTTGVTSLRLALLLLAAPISSLAAQDVPTVEPGSVGVSSEVLDRVDELTQGWVDAGRSAGTVILIARHGNIVHFEANGFRYKEANAAMTTDTIFRIASMTKSIASVALMILYEEGKIGLEDPISKWLPEFAELRVGSPDEQDSQVSAERPISVLHVLTHMSGLRWGNRDTDAGNIVEDVTRGVSKEPLWFQPGEGWDYGPSTDVVAALVEVISGRSLDEFLRVHIFEPLGMVDTHYNVPPAKIDRVAAIYQVDSGDNSRIALRTPPEPRPVTTIYQGFTGLASTAYDYFRFCQMLLNGGELDGVRILTPETVSLMITDHAGGVRPNNGFGISFSIHVERGRRWAISEGSFSWGGSVGTRFIVDPEEALVAIYMSQSPAPFAMLGQFEQLLGEAVVEPNTEPPAIRGSHRK